VWFSFLPLLVYCCFRLVCLFVFFFFKEILAMESSESSKSAKLTALKNMTVHFDEKGSAAIPPGFVSPDVLCCVVC
jgi:hypothetical protein